MKFQMLSKKDVEEIHAATLRVLEKTGVRVHSSEAIKLLSDAGCKISNDNLVKIPTKIVEESLSSVAKGFDLYDREGNHALTIKDRNVYFGTGVTNPNFRDINTGERRPTRVQDIKDAAKVADYLANLDWTMPLGSVQDVPPEVSDVYEFEAAVSNTTKPIVFICNDAKGVSDVLEMAEIIAGGRQNLTDKPFIISYPEPISPLVHMKEAKRNG